MSTPISISNFNQPVRWVLSDLDDTITEKGQVSSKTYESISKLNDHGISVIIVTGRPAGWCEMMARTWPIKGVIGENGALFYYLKENKMHRYYVDDEITQQSKRQKLNELANKILSQVPKAKLASDQFCRLFDLAIDICEDIPALTESEINKIMHVFADNGAQAKISSIHVNGWFGNYDKLTTSLHVLKETFHLNESEIKSKVAYIGDSPNDEPQFSYFENSFGVKNIEKYILKMKFKPKYVTSQEAGLGFQEFSSRLLFLFVFEQLISFS